MTSIKVSPTHSQQYFIASSSLKKVNSSDGWAGTSVVTPASVASLLFFHFELRWYFCLDLRFPQLGMEHLQAAKNQMHRARDSLSTVNWSNVVRFRCALKLCADRLSVLPGYLDYAVSLMEIESCTEPGLSKQITGYRNSEWWHILFKSRISQLRTRNLK